MNKYLLAAAIVLCCAPAKAQDLTMLENRFGLPVFQTGPNDKALWWTWRILTKHKQIGEAIFEQSEECEKYNHLADNPETRHIWCAANVPPYCENGSAKRLRMLRYTDRLSWGMVRDSIWRQPDK